MTIRTPIIATALALLSVTPSLASSGDSWDAFRKDVSAKCLAAQKKFGSAGKTTIEVNPFGSERFGVAILSTRLTNGGSTEKTVCIYDKAAKTAELTAPFGN